MPVPLMYEIGAEVGPQLKRAVRSVEDELKASNSRMASSARRSATGGRTTGDPAVKQAARGFDQIGRAARAADNKTIRDRMRAEERATAERIRNVKREAREQVAAETRAARDIASARKSSVERFGRGAATTVGGSVKKVVGLGANALALGGGLLGGMAATSAIESTVNLEHSQREIIRNARGPGQAGAFTQRELGQRVTDTALNTGASREGITEGLASFVAKTGDLKTAVENMGTFTSAAVASGADVKDVFSSAADLSSQMHIESIEDMRQAFADLIFQGKKGAFELKNMASELPELAATANRMGLSGVNGVRTLGGLMQLSMKGTGTGPEASTAFQNAMNQIVNKTGELQSGKAFDGRKVQAFVGGNARNAMLDIPTIIANMLQASRGNLTEINKVLEIRGNKALSPMTAAFRTAYQGAKGTDEERAKVGRDAVVKMMADAMDSGAKWRDVQEDARGALQDTSSQLEIARTRFTDAVGTQLLPVLTQLIPKFTEMVPVIGDAAGALAHFASETINNPIPNIGKIIAAKVALDLGEAALGNVAKSALQTAMNAATGGAIGAGGVLSVFVTGGLIGVTLGAAVGDAASRRLSAGTEVGSKTELELAQSRMAVLRGEDGGKLADPEQIEGRKRALQHMLADLQQNAPTALETTAGAASKVLGGSSAEEARQASITELQKAIDMLSAALAKGGDDLVNKISTAQVASNDARRTTPIHDR